MAPSLKPSDLTHHWRLMVDMQKDAALSPSAPCSLSAFAPASPYTYAIMLAWQHAGSLGCGHESVGVGH